MLAPDDKVVNILRTNGNGDDKAAIVHVADDGGTLSFDPADDFIDMPGGGVKFTIRYDKTTSRYWSIVSKQTNPEAVPQQSGADIFRRPAELAGRITAALPCRQRDARLAVHRLAIRRG